MEKIRISCLIAVMAIFLLSLPVSAQNNVESYRNSAIKNLTNDGFEKIEISSKIISYDAYIKAQAKEGMAMGEKNMVISLRINRLYIDYLLNLAKANGAKTDSLDRKTKEILSECLRIEYLYEIEVSDNDKCLCVKTKYFNKNGEVIFTYSSKNAISLSDFQKDIMGDAGDQENERLLTLFFEKIIKHINKEFIKGSSEYYFFNGDASPEYYVKKYYKDYAEGLSMFLSKDIMKKEDITDWGASDFYSYAKLFNTKDTLAMKAAGYRPANISDLLVFGIEYAEIFFAAMPGNYIIIAPGTVKKYRGSHYAPALELATYEGKPYLGAYGIDLDVINNKNKRLYLGIRNE